MEYVNKIIEKREKIKSEYGDLYDKLVKVYFEEDPIGINFGSSPGQYCPADEYEPEVDLILPKLKNCESEDDVLNLIHKVFCKMFTIPTAGPKDRYIKLAKQTRLLWQESGWSD